MGLRETTKLLELQRIKALLVAPDIEKVVSKGWLILAYILAYVLAYMLAYILAYILAYMLAYILAYILAYVLKSSCVSPGSLHHTRLCTTLWKSYIPTSLHLCCFYFLTLSLFFNALYPTNKAD